MSLRKLAERLAWRLAGFGGRGRVHPTSRIKTDPNPLELLPSPADRFAVISPHPDDEAIGCGGLICTALENGSAILVVHVTDGALGGDPGRRRQEAGAVRALCLETYGRTYDLRFLDQQELHLDCEALGRELESVWRSFSPTWVLVPHPEDNHRDHHEVSRVVRQVVGRLPRAQRPGLLGYEVWNTLRVGAFVDLSPHGDLKRRMIAVYESQTRTRDYAPMILALNAYRAACLPGRMALAEAFEIIELD